MMAQILACLLDAADYERRRSWAQRQGRSMEEEVRLILAPAVASQDEFSSCSAGLGSCMAALITAANLEGEIEDGIGETARPASFEASPA